MPRGAAKVKAAMPRGAAKVEAAMLRGGCGASVRGPGHQGGVLGMEIPRQSIDVERAVLENHMRAALCTSLEGPDAISIIDLATPTPGPGEVLVRVNIAALNFLDTLITRGKYQIKPQLPFSPAAEIAGIVEALGDGVEPDPERGVFIGARICCFLGWGGARSHIVVAADRVVPIPDIVSDEAAAGMSVTYGTALHGLKDRGRLQAGETVAILGASGGAGLAAIEIAKRLGGRVIAAASTDERLLLCREHGADEILNYTTSDLKSGLKALSQGRGVDIVYDCVGGDHAQLALRALAWTGRYLVIGFAAGKIPSLPLNLVLLKGCDICGVFWGEAVARDPAGHRANMREILGWIGEGVLTPHIHGTYPLSQIGSAIGLLDRREARGKVLITMS